MTEQRIIDPVDISLIESELTPDRLLRRTNKAGNEIYIVDAHSAPNIMREIGRLREISFRAGGGGTGKSCDIDDYSCGIRKSVKSSEPTAIFLARIW